MSVDFFANPVNQNAIMLAYILQLKQENEELRAELQVARERESKHPSISDRQLPNASRLTNDDLAYEKNMLRQELHSLQVAQDSICT